MHDRAVQLKAKLAKLLDPRSSPSAALRREAMGRYMNSTPLHTRDLTWQRYDPASPDGPSVMRQEIGSLVADFRREFAPYTAVPEVKSLYDRYDGMVFAWVADDLSVRPDDLAALRDDQTLRPAVRAKLAWMAQFVRQNGIWLLMPPADGAADPASGQFGNLSDKHLSDYGYAFAQDVPVTEGQPSIPLNVDAFNDKGAPNPRAQALLWQTEQGNPEMKGRVFEVVVRKTKSGLTGVFANFIEPRHENDTTGVATKSVPCLAFSPRFDPSDTDSYKITFSKFFINGIVPGSQWVEAPEGPEGPLKLVVGQPHLIQTSVKSGQLYRLQPYMDAPIAEIMASFSPEQAAAEKEAARQKALAYWTNHARVMQGKLNGAMTTTDRNRGGLGTKLTDEERAAMQAKRTADARRQFEIAERKVAELSQPVGPLSGAALLAAQVAHVTKHLRYLPAMLREPEAERRLFKIKIGDEQGGLILEGTDGSMHAMTSDQVRSILDPGLTPDGHRTDGRKLLYYYTFPSQPADADGNRKRLGYGRWDIAAPDRERLRQKYKPLMDLLSRKVQEYRAAAAAARGVEDYRPHSPPQHVKWIVLAPRFQTAEMVEGKARSVIYNRQFVDVVPDGQREARPPAASPTPLRTAGSASPTKEAQAAGAAKRPRLPRVPDVIEDRYGHGAGPQEGFKAQPGFGDRHWVVIVHDINEARFAKVGGKRYPYEAMKGDTSLSFATAHDAMDYIASHYPGITRLDTGVLDAATHALDAAKRTVAASGAKPAVTPEVRREQADIDRRATEQRAGNRPVVPLGKQIDHVTEQDGADLFSLAAMDRADRSRDAAPGELPPAASGQAGEAAPAPDPASPSAAKPTKKRAPRPRKPKADPAAPAVPPVAPVPGGPAEAPVAVTGEPQKPATLFATSRMVRALARKYGL